MHTHTHLFIDSRGRGEEQLGAEQLPWDEADPAVYAVGDMFGVAGYFRYDDGWRYLHDGPRSTVDRESLMTDPEWVEWDLEIGTTPGLTEELLEAARKRGPR